MDVLAIVLLVILVRLPLSTTLCPSMLLGVLVVMLCNVVQYS